jgi:hypothetical protein
MILSIRTTVHSVLIGLRIWRIWPRRRAAVEVERVVSKTDKTTPYFVVERRGECRGKCEGGYPCKHFSSSENLGVIKREMRRSERTRVRDAINVGMDEYEDVPVGQHKHRALWDLS